MAYQVLSRKWRPQKFQDVVGQEHVTRSLVNAITKDRLGHAYIMTGTRGIGKTSVARLFAKSLRCLERQDDGNPCGSCRACEEFKSGSSMNIFEIDGASNNSVDHIRDLINNVQTLPTFGNYKIYIIDEVHMLSASAFNALLKTLEEPPEHVIFILATTEPHKLLDTVLSRCQRFDFRNASVESLVSHINLIAEKEGIKFENNQIVETIAIQGSGSFRDTLSLLDQVLCFSSDGEITEEITSIALGLAKTSSIKTMSEGIMLGNAEEVSTSYRQLLFENISPENIARPLLSFFYDIIQNIDDPAKLRLSTKCVDFLKRVTIDEVFWLFESMTKDFSWGLEAIYPEKVCEIILLKHTRRSEILSGTGVTVTETLKKKPEITPPNKIEEMKEPAKHDFVEPVLPSPEPAVELNWQSFEGFLKKEIPAISAQLEQGNITEALVLTSETASIRYAFSESSKLFYEHLMSGEGISKVTDLMKSFFKVQSASIEIDYLTSDEAKEKNFLSKSELLEEKRKDDLKEREKTLREHPVVKETEKLFGKKIDKIKMNEE